MADDALKLLNSLREHVERKPASFDYRTEASLEQGTPASPNKRTGANGAWLVDSLNKGRFAVVNQVLDWWCWLAGQPFMQNEALTPEEIYRLLHANPHWLSACVAEQIGRADALAAARRLARSHIFWLLVGLAEGPGKSVTDHRFDAIGKGCIIVGDGRPKWAPMPYVVQPGMRGWVRNRGAGPKTFLWTEREALSVMVSQAMGWRIPRKAWPEQQKFAKAVRRRWPGMPTWTLEPIDLAAAQDYCADLTNPERIRDVARRLLVPRLPLRFDRYSDGAIDGALLVDQPSSTDPCSLDSAESADSDGYCKTRKGSAADGIRREDRRILAGSDTLQLLSWREGDEIGSTVRMLKPGSVRAWSLECGGGMVEVFAGFNILPPTAELPHVPVRAKRRRWYEVS